MLPAVLETLSALTVAPEDAAAVRLAVVLAETIDESPDRGVGVTELATKLLSVLTALGATPAARARVKAGGVPDGRSSRLEALRAARRTS
jgi:hypothetical protein